MSIKETVLVAENFLKVWSAKFKGQEFRLDLGTVSERAFDFDLMVNGEWINGEGGSFHIAENGDIFNNGTEKVS